MLERHDEPAEPDHARESSSEPAEPYAPPEITVLGTLADLTSGVNFGDGGDLHAYMS